MTRTTGRVKFWSRLRGYGFITCDDVDEDVLVHHSEIVGSGYKNLEAGERVEFTLEPNARRPGWIATGVVSCPADWPEQPDSYWLG